MLLIKIVVGGRVLRVRIFCIILFFGIAKSMF
jgi:hypothetical protein